MQRAVFIDRDGTISRDVNYCRRIEDFELLPGAITGIRLFNENGFKTIVITNQSGIARGYFNDKTLTSIHQKMTSELNAGGAHLDAIYYCPHHPDEDCECRKPKPKLAFLAIDKFDINCSESYVIGDRLMDVQLARNIGCKAIIINNTRGMNELNESPIQPDLVAVDLHEAALRILQLQNMLKRGN